MARCFSAVGVGTVIEHPWRAASGVMYECFSAVGVSTLIDHLFRTASGVMCECPSAFRMGTVIEHLWRAASGVMCERHGQGADGAEECVLTAAKTKYFLRMVAPTLCP